jgi:hypothetical protein
MNNKCRMYLSRFVQLTAVILGSMCYFSGTARAQQASGRIPQYELAGAYSFVRANGRNSNGSFNLNGGSASLAYNFGDRFAVVADAGSYRFRGLPSGLTSTMYTYMFGPRITLSQSRRITPFAQILVGGGRLNASSGGVQAGENGLTMAAGGGLDLSIHNHLAVRIVQAEYLLTRFDSVAGSSATQSNIRISAGVVLRFGKR